MTPSLLEKNVVLLGAGNAHLGFVRRWGMSPARGVAVTLVSESTFVPYSAMVPGLIGGDYQRDEITIDLVRLCRSSGVRLIAEPAVAIDTAGRRVRFANRPEVAYDALSLGLGSRAAQPFHGTADWPMRPLDKLIERIEKIPKGRPFHLVVVGGGASGCELALAIRKRFPAPHFTITILQADNRLTPSLCGRAGRLFAQRMAQAGIEVRLGKRVTADRPLSLDWRLNAPGNPPLPDAVLWATDAAPPTLLAHSGLKLSPSGFLLVQPTLQSLNRPEVFGTGDCVSFPAYPTLPKNGVHAVRQGGVLFDNIQRFLHDQSLRPFRPQWLTLSLLNTADGEAILSYGPFALKSRWARHWKDRIDRRWVQMFAPMPMPTSPTGPIMRCGGCGNKVSGDVLSAVLRRLDIPEDPRIVLGIHAGEDASAHRFDPSQFGGATLEVQTVDYFKSFVDDPFLFGRIAALNAVSDLYAMNARPFSALAIATLPHARGPVQEAMLYELLSGALESFRQLGVVLTGGHTTEGAELALGFAVTGHAEERTLFQKGALEPGDVLILTKRLGTGALLAEGMMTRLRAEWWEALFTGMLNANDRAAKVFARHEVRAVTDVTGFGLAGHLLEMLDGRSKSKPTTQPHPQLLAKLWPEKVPLYAGFVEAVRQQAFSTLHNDNARVGRRVVGPLHEWLFDPQTGGGLIAGVRPEMVERILSELHATGYADAVAIGEVQTGTPAIHT